MENFEFEKKVAALLGGLAPLPGSNPARKLAPTRHTPQLATLAKPPEVIKGRFHREFRHGQPAASDCLKWQYLALGRWDARWRLTDRQKSILYLTRPRLSSWAATSDSWPSCGLIFLQFGASAADAAGLLRIAPPLGGMAANSQRAGRSLCADA